MENFRKLQYEVISGSNKNNWLAVDVSKVGQDSAKRYVNSRCIVRIIDKKVEAIDRLHQIIQTFTKGINIMSTKMGGMGQDLHNTVKEMKYYAAKIYQVDKCVEVCNIFSFGSFFVR